MLIIEAEVIEEMPKARTEVDQNPKTKIRVSHTQDKLCVGIIKNLGISRKIAEI